MDWCDVNMCEMWSGVGTVELYDEARLKWREGVWNDV